MGVYALYQTDRLYKYLKRSEVSGQRHYIYEKKANIASSYMPSANAIRLFLRCCLEYQQMLTREKEEHTFLFLSHAFQLQLGHQRFLK